MYNFLHLFPRKVRILEIFHIFNHHQHGDYQSEYVQVFQKIVSDLISENQLKNILEFQLNADDYIIVRPKII